jgi:hypothetical protein
MSHSDTNTQDRSQNPKNIPKDVVQISSSEPISLGNANNNLIILYITFAIIIGLLIIWIIIVVVTKEDPIKILNDMTNLATQIKAVSDQPI